MRTRVTSPKALGEKNGQIMKVVTIEIETGNEGQIWLAYFCVIYRVSHQLVLMFDSIFLIFPMTNQKKRPIKTKIEKLSWGTDFLIDGWCISTFILKLSKSWNNLNSFHLHMGSFINDVRFF